MDTSPPAASTRWIGRVFFVPDGVLYRGAVAVTDLHEHHAHQLMLSPERPMRLFGGQPPAAVEARAMAIPSGAPHAIAAPCPDALVLWIDPELSVGRRVTAALEPGQEQRDWSRAATQLEVAAVPVPDDAVSARAAARAMLSALGVDEVRARPLHPAVARAVREVAAGLDASLSLEDVARSSGVSASRLRHLFREQLGSTFRAWVLWCRLRRAIEAVQRGDNLTTAAHEAGFSDAAHMSRSFRRMLGVSPSDAVGAVEWIDAAL